MRWFREHKSVEVRKAHAGGDVRRLTALLRAGWTVHLQFTVDHVDHLVLRRWRIPFISALLTTVVPDIPQAKALSRG